MANSRIKRQNQSSVNSEGYTSTSSGTATKTPGRQTTRVTRGPSTTRQSADDEGITITMRIPIDGIC